jgi:hypothetical protein
VRWRDVAHDERWKRENRERVRGEGEHAVHVRLGGGRAEIREERNGPADAGGVAEVRVLDALARGEVAPEEVDEALDEADGAGVIGVRKEVERRTQRVDDVVQVDRHEVVDPPDKARAPVPSSASVAAAALACATFATGDRGSLPRVARGAVRELSLTRGLLHPYDHDFALPRRSVPLGVSVAGEAVQPRDNGRVRARPSAGMNDLGADAAKCTRGQAWTWASVVGSGAAAVECSRRLR